MDGCSFIYITIFSPSLLFRLSLFLFVVVVLASGLTEHTHRVHLFLGWTQATALALPIKLNRRKLSLNRKSSAL